MSTFTIFDCLSEDQKKAFSFPKIYRTHIPREHWKHGEIYFNLKNKVWIVLTDGRFPAKDNRPDKDSHSLYVKDVTRYTIRIYPMSTARQYELPYWYIPAGKTKDIPADSQTQKDDVYVLKDLECGLPKNKISGEDRLYYGGFFEESLMVEIK